MSELSIRFETGVRFTTTAPVPVEDVIRSLRGMERLVNHNLSRAILGITGAHVKDVSLHVKSIEDGSLIPKCLVTLFFGSEEELQKCLKSIRSKFVTRNAQGEIMVKAPAVIGSIIIATAIGGLVVHKYVPSKGAGGLISVNGNNNSVVVVGSEAWNSSPQEFVQAIERSVKATNPTRTGQASADFFAPASHQPGANVELQHSTDGKMVVVAPAQFIRQIPETIESPDETYDNSYENVTVRVRASDIDHVTRGWAATIDGVTDKRTRMVFADDSLANAVAFKQSFNADISITWSDKKGDKAILIVVNKLR